MWRNRAMLPLFSSVQITKFKCIVVFNVQLVEWKHGGLCGWPPLWPFSPTVVGVNQKTIIVFLQSERAQQHRLLHPTCTVTKLLIHFGQWSASFRKSVDRGWKSCTSVVQRNPNPKWIWQTEYSCYIFGQWSQCHSFTHSLVAEFVYRHTSRLCYVAC